MQFIDVLFNVLRRKLNRFAVTLYLIGSIAVELRRLDLDSGSSSEWTGSGNTGQK